MVAEGVELSAAAWRAGDTGCGEGAGRRGYGVLINSWDAAAVARPDREGVCRTGRIIFAGMGSDYWRSWGVETGELELG